MKTLLIGLILLPLLIFSFLKFAPLRLVLPFFTKNKPVINGSLQLFQLGGTSYYLYLPPQYKLDKTQSFSSMYHLHGAMPFAWPIAKKILETDIQTTAALQEKQVVAKRTSPKIIIAPYDGVGTSMWSDSWDGAINAESFLIDSLLPYIQKHYRVKAGRESRTIQGFSMGGFGAMKIAFKFPELFAKAISWDGALHSWQTLSKHRKGIAKEVFNSEDHFLAHSPWELSVRYGAKKENQVVKIFLIQGALSVYNSNFREHLLSLELAFHFIETDCGHDLSCLMDTETTHIAYDE